MKPKVLIVDDDAAVAQQLYWALCDYYEVITANDLQSALRRLAIYEPSVAILDLHLPPTENSPDSGFSILKYMKSRLPDSKVFVVSSSVDRTMLDACLKGGADEVFSKPIESDQILSVLLRHAPVKRVGRAV